jgi:hypothetical protein
MPCARSPTATGQSPERPACLMSSHLLTEPTNQAAVVAAALGTAAIMKALASVLRTWIEQASQTRRLTKALEDSRPNQRPEIIMACSQLEGRRGGEADADAPDGKHPTYGHSQSPMLILEDKRDLEHRGS